MESIGFIPQSNKNEEFSLEDYLGEYVYIYVNQAFFSGRVSSIEENYLVLNPHKQRIYNKNLWPVEELIEKPSLVGLSHIVGIEPITRENLEALCALTNKQQEEAYQRSLKNPENEQK